MPPGKPVRRLKWPKNPPYASQMSAASREAGLRGKELARRSGWSFGQIKRLCTGDHISLPSHQHVLQVINNARAKRGLASIDIEYPWKIDGPTARERWDTEKLFQSLTRTNIYKNSAEIAEQTFKRCRSAGQFLAAAHWADHAAGEYRKQGNLKAAQDCLEDCFRAMTKAKRKEKESVEMRVIRLRANFERTMIREYMILGEFPKALKSFEALDADVDALADEVPENHRDKLLVRKTHHKRGRAEMLRLSGRYADALVLIEEAFHEYPDWADESRRQCELHKADSLRLLGRAKESLDIYERLERAARNRHLDGFLGSVLWTKVGALQIADRRDRKRELNVALSGLQTLARTDGNQYGYLFIYSKLVSVSANLGNSAAADQVVNDAMAAGPLEPDWFRTEYAHAMLCRGEIERSQKYLKQAQKAQKAQKCYSEALRLYEMMEMRWGIVRSTVGLNLTGRHHPLPTDLKIEGCDKMLWSDFLAGRDLPAGMLCENIP